MKWIIGVIAVVLMLLVWGFFSYGSMRDSFYEVIEGGGSASITVSEGDDVFLVADTLKDSGLIQRYWVFVVGAWQENLHKKLKAGTYDIARGQSPYEVLRILTKEVEYVGEVEVTFPEGWTAKKMADRLSARGLDGETFYAIVSGPYEHWFVRYSFLREAKATTLEGYLFPDTYRFGAGDDAEQIVSRMLDTFERKVIEALEGDFDASTRSLGEIITMASIIETEVRTTEDRKKVSNIFWKRLDDDFLLQSDATLEYVLSTNAVQHNAEDLEADTLYNSYKHKGLPPGPVSNPSVDAIKAALAPESTPYYYFLSDPATGKTYFAENYDTHLRNKTIVGL